MKSILLIVMLILLPGVSRADKIGRERRVERREKKEMKRQQKGPTKKFDNRSRKQKRKDRNVLCLIALAGALVFSQLQE